MRRSFPIAWLLLGGLATSVAGGVVSKPIDDPAIGRAVLFYDDAHDAPRTGVLLAHDAAEQASESARAWARLGHAVLAIDLAGDDPARRQAIRTKLTAALNLLKRQPQVDPRRLAAIGIDGGSGPILELAGSGAEVKGIVCAGGNPAPPSVESARRLSGRVQVLIIPAPDLPAGRRKAMEDALSRGRVDWRTATERDGAIESFLARLGMPARPSTPSRPSPEPEPRPDATPKSPIKLPDGVPAKVGRVLAHVDETGNALPGYEGGRNFLNLERLLPQTDRQNRKVRYREWDVNPLRPGVNRGAERLVTGSDGSAFYTSDHYRSFQKIR